MIDAGIWGQLPSLINAGVFASSQQPCTFAGTCGFAIVPPPGIGNGYVSAGTTPLCTLPTFTVAPAGATLRVTASIDYTPGVGSGSGGVHQLWFVDAIDGTTMIDLGASIGNVRKQQNVGTTLLLPTAGVHTLVYSYFVNTTGIGFDILWAGSIQASVCPV